MGISKMNRNADFNIEQILDTYAEILSGEDTVSRLNVLMDEYEVLLTTLRAEMMNIGSVTPEIKEKLDKNVKYIMDQIYSILNSSITLRKVSSKREENLKKLAKGVKYAYRLTNNTHVMAPEFLRFDKVGMKYTDNTLVVGDLEFQFSEQTDFNTDESELDITGQKTINPNLHVLTTIKNALDDAYTSNPDDKPVYTGLCTDHPYDYDSMAINIADVIELAYTFVVHHQSKTVFETYFNDIVKDFNELENLVKNRHSYSTEAAGYIVEQLTNKIYQLDQKLVSKKNTFNADSAFDGETSFKETVSKFFDNINRYLDDGQDYLQNWIDKNDINNIETKEFSGYLVGFENEIRKTRHAKCRLDISNNAMKYIRESIKDDVVHFNLFDEKALDAVIPSN